MLTKNNYSSPKDYYILKAILLTLGIFISCLLLGYGLIVFASLEPNIFKWHSIDRGLLVALSAAFTAIFCMVNSDRYYLSSFIHKKGY